MLLKNSYYWFKEVLTPKFCDDVIKYGNSKNKKTALIGGIGENRDLNKNPLTKKEIKNLQKIRKSEVIWMTDQWIYKEIIPYVKIANQKAGWNFQFDRSEACQFTTYGPGQYYDWHCDSNEDPYKRENENDPEHGKIRKLSVTCSLTDPKKYKGGELEFNFNRPNQKKKYNIKKCIEILPKGSIVVFPSFVWHRVCPVTKGTRNSLVIWSIGWPFK